MQNAIWSIRTLAAQGMPGIRQLCRILFRLIELAYGAYIPIGAKFAGRPCFPHGMHGVFVSGASRLGHDCVLFQQVTIGSNTLIDSSGFGSPLIGDRCYIGTGARLIGGIRIGDDVRVGANAVVTRDVPDYATVVGLNQIFPSNRPKDNRVFRRHSNGWQFFRDGDWRMADVETSDQLNALAAP